MQEFRQGEPFTFSCDGNDLEAVLSHYGFTFQEMASGGKIMCPFHGDVRPSMVVDFSDGSFHCFGCEAHGDALSFVQGMEPGLSEFEAVRKLLRIVKGCAGKRRPPSRKVPRNDPVWFDIAKDYYYNLPKTDWGSDGEEAVSCREYMEKRGFSPETLGKVGAKVSYSMQYPIIFPMMDNGRFRGWVGRAMDPEVEQNRKYFYNKGFSRLTTLVGDYGKLPYVFVVEGYMDWLRFRQCGCRNVVAVLGWKMTRPQEEKLKAAGVQTVISALDNDKCGRKGTAYLKTRFKEVLRFRYMKGVKDPGEMEEQDFWKMYAKTFEERWVGNGFCV